MASYLPTLREFVEKSMASPYGCKLLPTTIPTIGPQGPVTWTYLKRGEDKIAILPDIHEDERIAPSKLRSMIADLNLPPMEFWMNM